jgi:hypothetical protein
MLTKSLLAIALSVNAQAGSAPQSLYFAERHLMNHQKRSAEKDRFARRSVLALIAGAIIGAAPARPLPLKP